jgi:hypothetical protein
MQSTRGGRGEFNEREKTVTGNIDKVIIYQVENKEK